MGEPFFGEIRIFPYGNVPKGWVRAEGQELSIQQYSALFALMGTTYGGDGKLKFKLPDLRGRIALGLAEKPRSGEREYVLGAQGGAESVTLTSQGLPSHTHAFNASDDVGKLAKATGATVAAVDTDGMTPPNDRLLYATGVDSGDLVSLNPTSLSSAGGGADHPNMQPYAVASYCICMVGLWPDRS